MSYQVKHSKKNTIKNIKLLKIKKFYSQRGKLFSLEHLKVKLKNSSPISIKRIFITYGNSKYFRGNHAHKKCNQFLICINGRIKIKLTDMFQKNKEYIISSSKNKGVFIPKLIWNKIYFLKKNSILLVICDYKYDRKKEYIENYNNFIQGKF